MADDKKSRKPERTATLDNPPTAVNQIDFDYMISCCTKNNSVKWLQEVALKRYVGKDGVERRYGLFQMRKEFVDKYMPQLHQPKPKKLTIYDRIAAL